jgi:hypothetical protein
MGSGYPTSKERNGISKSRPPYDGCLDAEIDTDVVSLLEENARLRALVTQLSGLVIKHVVDQK